MRKIIQLLLIVAILFSSTHTSMATDYSSNEDYWYKTCNGDISKDLLSACNGFTQYLENKANNLESKLDEIDEQIQEIKDDLDKLIVVANDIQKDIDEKDAEIKVLQVQIDELEKRIETVEKEIELKEEDIKIRDAQIKERMVQTQTFNRSHGYISFIMGASDFIDLIRRISIMNQITSYEQNQIEILNADIEQLAIDKQEIEIQKEGIVAQRKVLEREKAEIEEMKARQAKLIKQFKDKEEDLMEAYMNSKESISSIVNNMPEYTVSGDAPVSSSGFGKVANGYRSAGTWYYPASFGGARHSGMDLAAPQGTPIYASFNGIVAIAQNITSAGGLGTRPYTGNNILLIGQVGGNTYAMHMLHMQYNSIKVSAGQTVTKGQVIGAIGSTGNSTGPHVHIDLYNLGKMSVQEAYNYVKRTGSYTFGMSYHAYGWECSNKAPVCRERPEDKIPY